jgi:transposase
MRRPRALRSPPTHADRIRVVGLHEAGYSTRAIARELRLDHSFVRRWVKNFQLYGHVDNAPRSGRPRKRTAALVGRVQQMMEGEHNASTRSVAARVSRSGNAISRETVRRIARDAGLQPYHRAKKPLLIERHRLLRRKFAREHRTRDWDNGVFSDETTFWLFPLPNRKTDVVWARSAADVPPAEIPKHVPRINAYMAFSVYGKSRMRFFKKNLNKELYVDILEDTLQPFVDREMAHRPWFYVHDRDPKHTSYVASDWLAEHQSEKLPTDWFPPNSPDLNPAENLWSTLGNAVRAHHPTTLEQLQRVIRDEWRRVDSGDLAALVGSMPDRLKAVRDAKGAHTRY